MSDRVYRVEVSREHGSWLAHVVDLDGVQTWARNLPNLDLAIREAIALAEDLPDGAESVLNLAYEYLTGDTEIDEAATQLRAERKRVQQAERELAVRTAALARKLVTEYRMSVRDTAALLDVSMQRISQIAPAARASNSEALNSSATQPKSAPRKASGAGQRRRSSEAVPMDTKKAPDSKRNRA